MFQPLFCNKRTVWPSKVSRWPPIILKRGSHWPPISFSCGKPCSVRGLISTKKKKKKKKEKKKKKRRRKMNGRTFSHNPCKRGKSHHLLIPAFSKLFLKIINYREGKTHRSVSSIEAVSITSRTKVSPAFWMAYKKVTVADSKLGFIVCYTLQRQVNINKKQVTLSLMVCLRGTSCRG